MPREGRPFWWPRCSSCGRWLSWGRMGEHDMETPWRCARCALAAETPHLSEETA